MLAILLGIENDKLYYLYLRQPKIVNYEKHYLFYYDGVIII